jgi:hypothetical protein
MTNGNNNDSPGLGAQITAGFLLVLFVAGSILPTLDSVNGGGGAPLATNSIVSQQQQQTNHQQYSLSRVAIQEKLGSIPVFILVENGGTGRMSTDIYASYNDAKEAAGSGSGSVVKATSLDQVMCVEYASDFVVRWTRTPFSVSWSPLILLLNSSFFFRSWPFFNYNQHRIQSYEYQVSTGTETR